MSEYTKSVVITGASSGFGEAAVRAFADHGYRVWGTLRDASGRNAARKAALEAHSPEVSIVEMDVTSDASVVEGFARILAEGPVDILINNAGIMYIGMTEAYSVAQAHEQMDTNYLGAIRTMQAVLPSMRAAGSGLIINTSSIAGRVSVPFFGTYCATKHALEAYSQSLRYEVAPFGIDVALVEPGPFPSNLLAAGKPPARSEVLDSYGALKDVPAAMVSGFADMLASDQAPDPQLVIDAYTSLADMAPGKRPTRTVVGITWGVDEVNSFTQPRQDALLKAMQLDTVLGGADA
jgi:NAD(P)-dependent dehydrogenase (short-subunit alcohol dehydrogenase family)